MGLIFLKKNYRFGNSGRFFSLILFEQVEKGRTAGNSFPFSGFRENIPKLGLCGSLNS
jgi:hypothetical protein